MGEDFGEPWHIGHNLDDHIPPRWPTIDNAKNLIVILPTTEEDADKLLPRLERIVAAVNFCQHLPTETLEALTRERIGAATLVQWIRKSHVYHEDFGACAASDSEWGEVCIECNHRIDLTRLHAGDCLLKQALDIVGKDV